MRPKRNRSELASRDRSVPTFAIKRLTESLIARHFDLLVRGFVLDSTLCSPVTIIVMAKAATRKRRLTAVQLLLRAATPLVGQMQANGSLVERQPSSIYHPSKAWAFS